MLTVIHAFPSQVKLWHESRLFKIKSGIPIATATSGAWDKNSLEPNPSTLLFTCCLPCCSHKLSDKDDEHVSTRPLSFVQHRPLGPPGLTVTPEEGPRAVPARTRGWAFTTQPGPGSFLRRLGGSCYVRCTMPGDLSLVASDRSVRSKARSTVCSEPCS